MCGVSQQIRMLGDDLLSMVSQLKVSTVINTILEAAVKDDS